MTLDPFIIFIISALTLLCFWRFCVANEALQFREVFSAVREGAGILRKAQWIVYVYLILSLTSALVLESNRVLSRHLMRRKYPESFSQMTGERLFSASRSLRHATVKSWRTAGDWLMPSLPLAMSAWLPAILFFRFRRKLREEFFRSENLTKSRLQLLWFIILVGVVASFASLASPFALTFLTMMPHQTTGEYVLVWLLAPIHLLGVGLTTLLLCGIISAAFADARFGPAQLLRVDATAFQRLLVLSVAISLCILVVHAGVSVLTTGAARGESNLYEIWQIALGYLLTPLYAFVFLAPFFIVGRQWSVRDAISGCSASWKAHWRILLALFLVWVGAAFCFEFLRELVRLPGQWQICSRVVFGLTGALASALSLVVVAQLLQRLAAVPEPPVSSPDTRS